MDTFSLNSPGFLNLLGGQSSETIDLESSELPRFSSQRPEDSKIIERRKWTPKEDVILISAWLNTSKDPIVANEQKGGTFWKRIHEYFNSSPQLCGEAPREHTHCKQRWGRLNELVCKFVGSYKAALKEQRSGQSENDVMQAAHEIFFNDYGSKFTLEHAWRVLRFNQKWASTCLTKDGSKEKRKEAGEADAEEVVSEARPPGVKACKAAKCKKNGNEAYLEKLQTMLVVKENISKQKLLQCLIANSATLTEEEVSLKNKLTTEMLGSG